MTEEVQQNVVFNIIINSRGVEDAKKAKDALGELNDETKKQEESQGNAVRSGIKMVNHLNRLQNVVFRAAVLTGLYNNTNKETVAVLKAVAIGLDVAFAAARAMLIVTDAARAADSRASKAALVKWIASSGPAAPLMAATILGAIAFALTALSVYTAQSAAGGGIFDSPTFAVIGDSPSNPEYVLNQQQMNQLMSQGGGGGMGSSVNVFIEGKHIQDVLARQEIENRLRGA